MKFCVDCKHWRGIYCSRAKAEGYGEEDADPVFGVRNTEQLLRNYRQTVCKGNLYEPDIVTRTTRLLRGIFDGH